MSPLHPTNSNYDLDHTPASSFGNGDPKKSVDVVRPASTDEVFRQALDTFEPDDFATLIRSMAASSSAHVLLVLPLFIYGSFLALQPTPTPNAVEGPKPMAATFIFNMKEKTPEPSLDVAQAEPPEEEKVEPPKVRKKPRRVTKKVRKTAPRRPQEPQEPPPVIAEPAPTPAYVAPAAETAQGPTVVLAGTLDPALPSGPGTSLPDGEVTEGTPSDFDLKGTLAAYKRKLSRALKKDYNYPRAAKRAGLEGRAIVRILIDARGNVLSVELAMSSGHEILDKAALEAARSVKHVPAAPDSLHWGERHIKVPFKFRSA